MDYYTGITFITAFFMAAMMVITKSNLILEKKVQNGFIKVFSMVVAVAVCEWIGCILEAPVKMFIILKSAAKCCEFSLAPCIPVFCAYTMSGFKRSKIVEILLASHALLEILSAFFGFIYYVDGSNVYHHGPLYGIYISAYIAGFIFFLYISLLLKKKYQSRNIGTLGMIIAFLVCCIPIQMINSDIRVDWLAVSIDAVFCYIFYNQLILQVDSTTMLLNKTCYNSYLGNIHEPVTIVMFDVNNFKMINDSYGHQYGDECLKTVGSAILNTYGKYGRCFRIGGDEFSAVIPVQSKSNSYVRREFENYMQWKREHDERLPKVAIGSCIYSPGEDTLEDTIKSADDIMYENKKIGVNIK